MSLLERMLSDLARPRWEGAPGFDKSWNGCMRMAQELHLERFWREWMVGMLETMHEARVLVIDGPQLEALPLLDKPNFKPGVDRDPDWLRVQDVMAHLTLPFEHVFIEFSGGVRRADYDSAKTERVVGALVTRGTPHREGAKPDGLMVMPYLESGDCLGMLIERTEPEPEPLVTSPMFGLPKDRLQRLVNRSGEESLGEWAAGIQVIISDLAERALATLVWLESANVNIVEPTLSRQVRRRAQREQREIAKIITVRRPATRTRSIRRGGTRDYSHQWEVAAHYIHQPATAPMSRAKPETLSWFPEINGGSYCRRIWCPAHIKGPENKPFVPKTRQLVTQET